ncbi:MAG: hypothetical protein JWO40_257 [Candidatus Doudnabacteria bacterium]|nr:hypothetical protein [Candidatus Doudnabacteria bacterium]
MKKFLISIVAVLLIVGVGIYFANQDSKPVKTNDFSSVPGDSQLLNNMTKAGLDALSAEGTVLHIHQHIDIVINGQPITIPAHVGIGSSFISPLHIHDTTNILHVESPVQKDFTLGQFFDEWGVDFNNQCIGTYCVDATHQLVVSVNGKQIDNPRDHVLGSHEEIFISYGTKDQTPQPATSYTFPEGY